MLANLIVSLKQKNRLPLFLCMLLSTVFSLGLVFFRLWHTGHFYYAFIIWNLFLAWLPYGAALWLPALPDKPRFRLVALPILAFWLLFFPNSPYILTDMFHLKAKIDMPLWYDLLLLLSAAWTGLMLGLLSLLEVERYLVRRIGRTGAALFTLACLALGSFGIYLGRVLRWNSWDIVTNPWELALDIATRVLHPFRHSHTIGMTLLFTIFLALAYTSLRLLSHESKES